MRRARRRAGRSVPRGALVLAIAMSACSKSGSPANDSARAASATTRVPAAGQAGASDVTSEKRAAPCPKTGHWSECQVHERLIRSGLAPRDTTRAALPALGPAPLVYRLGKGGLAVYLFPDSAARARAAGTLDTVRFVPASGGPTMLSQAMVIENDNLLGLLFSKNDQQIERVSDALTAGAPQP
jgi:hypothetical protein